jgi:tetraacyldisaccharide 4'-kinase
VDLETVQSGGGGPLGTVLRGGLTLLSWGFGLGVHARRALYATGLRRAEALPVPVVSVGNLAVGGTGKTPFVAWLARGLLARGHHPGILARGYGPRAATGDLSDEGAVLRHLLGDAVPQVEDPRRVRGGARLLEAHPGTDALLLDDGFQHLALRRDLDIVLLDATNPLGYGRLLPRGRLREPPRALARAGVVVLTRIEQVPEDRVRAARTEVARHTDAPVVLCKTRPVGLEVAGRMEEPARLRGRRVFAACGVGSPRGFEATLCALGAEVLGRRFLADHAAVGEAGWAEIEAEAAAAGASEVVITRKDAVKRKALPPHVAVLDVEAEVVGGEEALWSAVTARIR